MLLLSAMSHAQSNAPSPKAAGDAGGFSAKGLNYETELTALYLGDFAHSRLQRDGHDFDFLFGNYLKAFARRCSAYLPPNKVEMTRPECVREQYTVNRYGVRTGPPTCVEYRQVGTGLYADPDLYAAQQKVEVEVGRNMMRDAVRGMAGNWAAVATRETTRTSAPDGRPTTGSTCGARDSVGATDSRCTSVTCAALATTGTFCSRGPVGISRTR